MTKPNDHSRTVSFRSPALFLILALLQSVHPSAFGATKVKLISFNDVKPSGSSLDECWGGVGIDHNQKVYVAFSDRYSSGPDNVLIFRYDTKTGAREYLGSARGISQAEGNLGSNETFAKVHVSFLEYRNKIYFATHDFHGSDDITKHRGAHFYAFDLATETFEDLSKHEPGGVSVQHQGIIAFEILRENNKLAGLTYPYGDLVIYDLDQKSSSFYPAPSDITKHNVAREIIATRKGKVYFAYGTNPNPFWMLELDVAIGVIKRTDKQNIYHKGSTHGLAATRDRNTVYVADLEGDLYAFDVEDERLDYLGKLLPPGESKGVDMLGGVILSNDEKKLFTLPYARDRYRGSNVSMRLYEYDIATGAKTMVSDLFSVLGKSGKDVFVTGTNVIDNEGRIYFGRFEYGSSNANSGKLVQIYDIPSSPACQGDCEAPAPPSNLRTTNLP